jgi:hypothetical protein
LAQSAYLPYLPRHPDFAEGIRVQYFVFRVEKPPSTRTPQPQRAANEGRVS